MSVPAAEAGEEEAAAARLAFQVDVEGTGAAKENGTAPPKHEDSEDQPDSDEVSVKALPPLTARMERTSSSKLSYLYRLPGILRMPMFTSMWSAHLLQPAIGLKYASRPCMRRT